MPAGVHGKPILSSMRRYIPGWLWFPVLIIHPAPADYLKRGRASIFVVEYHAGLLIPSSRGLPLPIVNNAGNVRLMTL